MAGCPMKAPCRSSRDAQVPDRCSLLVRPVRGAAAGPRGQPHVVSYAYAGGSGLPATQRWRPRHGHRAGAADYRCGLVFDIIRVKQVRRGSPGEQAGFKVGDQIVAVDGHVFPTLGAFASYVGSLQPGKTIKVDYIPAGGGPQQAQRLVATVGEAGHSGPPRAGLSTGTKIAIGGAVRLLRDGVLQSSADTAAPSVGSSITLKLQSPGRMPARCRNISTYGYQLRPIRYRPEPPPSML